MKRYWKSSVICVVILLVIGTFYINSATSASEYPEFVIKKQGGDGQEVDSVVLDGYYEVGSVGAQLQVTSEGSLYNNEKSFLDQFRNNQGPMINKLQKEHRNFMRGKYKYINNFYEDDQFLIYAAVDSETNTGGSDLTLTDFTFTISMLDKASDDIKNYEVDVPTNSGDRTLNMMVEDVQMFEGQLELITRNYSGDSGDQIHLYTFDESIKQVESDDTLFFVPEQDGKTPIRFSPLKEMDPKQAHERIVYAKIIGEETPQGEDTIVTEKIDVELISYNLKTKKKEQINVPKSLQVEGRNTVYDGSTIYFTENNEGDFIVKPFSLKDKKVKGEIMLDQSKAENNEGLIEIKNGKIYALTNITDQESNAKLKVIDIKTGKKVYEGEITRKNSATKPGENDLFIHQIVVK